VAQAFQVKRLYLSTDDSVAGRNSSRKDESVFMRINDTIRGQFFRSTIRFPQSYLMKTKIEG